MKRANKQIQSRAVSRNEQPRVTPQRRRRLLMEGLERRELMAFNSFASPSGNGGDDSGTRFSTMARNIGTVTAFRVTEVEPNSTFGQAQLLPLGTGAGDRNTIDVAGQLTLANPATRTFADVDYFAVDLEAGDILDIATLGSVGAVDVFYAPNQPWFGAEIDASLGGTAYPYASPLQTLGDITIAQTVPVTGRYYIQLSVGAIEGSYTMGLRAYRPVMEQAPIGQKQVLYLDFDGASYLRSEFDPAVTGVARLSPLSSFLQSWGLSANDENALIDKIIAVVEENFNQDLAVNGNNGFFDTTGIAGQFGIDIRNSRDDADMYGIDPYYSRVIVGGTVTESGVDTIGLASSIDVGNFDTNETAFVLLDQIDDFILPIAFTASHTVMDTISRFVGNVVTHEAGHYFGAWHQDNSNPLVSLMDQGGDIIGFTDAGLDQIFGTLDDNDTDFTDDFFTPNEGIAYGREDTINAMAFNLSTGKLGGGISGTVYSDANRNGSQNSGEGGLAGIVVYADLNNDGTRNSNEPASTTDSSGNFGLAVAAGTVVVRMITPAGFNATTPASRTVTVTANSSVDVDFGLNRVVSDVTGFKWNDINGNGIREADEPGIGGVYIYLDLDGDNRLDLGEPRGVSKDDGSYSINFPGPGTYTIREVVEPGFVQTFPVSGEHIVVYNGTLLTDNYNFGNRSVQDYGDAPAPYPTTAVNNGAVHGYVAGLTIGQLLDAEADGLPTAGATGDDTDGIDDEDGVSLRSPLAPGATSTIDVSVKNSTGSAAYLSGWLDLNQDGDWSDAGEKIFSDILVSSSVNAQTISPLVAIPATASVGNSFLRVRLSQVTGVGVTGFTSAGEVEDHAMSISATPELANDDTIDVPRGALAFPINVLGNDFNPAFNPLTITGTDTTGTLGQVQISQDKKSIFYTPRSNTLGPDSFTYTVINASGATDTARVNVNVVFQSAVPIAVDDSFNLPQGSGNQALNVLGNDIPSVAGGTRIIATSSPTQGGTVSITSGGQSLRYTPAAGFNRTEQFTYTVADALGQISTAKVTIHLQPGTLDDDKVNFIVETFANDGITPINTIPAGQKFKVRVSVDDLQSLPPGSLAGLGSAYLDLLYTDGLVATIPATNASSGFPYEIAYGPLFTTVKTGDALTPGIFNEIGATQAGLGTAHSDAAELFTLTLIAVSPGIAEFVADPADATISDVVVLSDTSRELTPTEIRFGRKQLTIVPSDSDFVYAVDDSYPDQLDSNGNPIVAGGNAVLDVLENDNFGPTGEVTIVNVGAAANGSATLNNNNTPNDTLDDFIVYRATAGFVGVDQFQYTIVSSDGIQSTAEVTVTVGATAGNDDLVDIDLKVFNSAGVENGPVLVGQTFDLQIWVDDLRAPLFGEPRGVFAAYMDLLYRSELAQPANSTGNRLGFDVLFGSFFDDETAVGDAFVPGLINEFGTFQTTTQGSGDPLQSDPVLLATVKMLALAPGQLKVIADPADVSPFQDTLLFQPPDVVPISQISYDLVTVNITGGGGGEGESTFQNPFNRMDVNADNYVSPIDALLVLNRLNRTSAEGEGDSTGDGAKKVYWDVNGDKRMSPIDALQIINFLNRKSPGAAGEGEAGPALQSGFGVASMSDYSAAADSIFDELGRDSLVTGGFDADDSVESSELGHGTCGPNMDQDDDDQDGLLGKLTSNL